MYVRWVGELDRTFSAWASELSGVKRSSSPSGSSSLELLESELSHSDPVIDEFANEEGPDSTSRIAVSASMEELESLSPSLNLPRWRYLSVSCCYHGLLWIMDWIAQDWLSNTCALCDLVRPLVSNSWLEFCSEGPDAWSPSSGALMFSEN